MPNSPTNKHTEPVIELAWENAAPVVAGVYIQWRSPTEWDILNVVHREDGVLVGEGWEHPGLSRMPIEEYSGKWLGPIPHPSPC